MTAPHIVLRSPNPTNVASSGGMSRVTSCDRIREQSLKRVLRETLTTEHGSESRLACSTYLNRSCTLRNLLLFLL